MRRPARRAAARRAPGRLAEDAARSPPPRIWRTGWRTSPSASSDAAGEPSARSSRIVVPTAATRTGQIGFARNASRSASGIPTISRMNVASAASRSPASTRASIRPRAPVGLVALAAGRRRRALVDDEPARCSPSAAPRPARSARRTSGRRRRPAPPPRPRPRRRPPRGRRTRARSSSRRLSAVTGGDRGRAGRSRGPGSRRPAPGRSPATSCGRRSRRGRGSAAARHRTRTPRSAMPSRETTWRGWSASPRPSVTGATRSGRPAGAPRWPSRRRTTSRRTRAARRTAARGR